MKTTFLKIKYKKTLNLLSWLQNLQQRVEGICQEQWRWRQRKSLRGLQVPLGLGTMWRGLDHGEEERQTIPAFSILRNSVWAEASLPGSKQRALANTGGPGTVERSWKTPCLGEEAEKPVEERTAGYSEGVSRFHSEPAGDGRRTVRGGRRRNGEERICIQNPSSGHINQQGMVTEKIGA